MTLSQTLELAIYKFVESVGKGQARTASLTNLSGLVAGSTDRDVCDSLIRLADRSFAYLDKWHPNENRFLAYTELQDKYSFFFAPPYGDPRIRITAEGRPHFEALEQLALREQSDQSSDTDAASAHARARTFRRIRSGLRTQLEEMRQISDTAELSGASASPVIALFREAGELLPGLVPEFHFYARPTAFRPQIAHVLSIVEDAMTSEVADHVVDPPATNEPGTFKTAFALYRVLNQLGEGGTGTVFEVREEDGSHFALKLLKPSALSKQRLKRFRNEIWFCSNNRHENIISVLDFGLAGPDRQGAPFYVMPLFHSTLRGLMKRRLEPARILRLFRQILNGVEAAHLQGVWHRDLKPENILYDPDADHIVVADFGIAHFAEPLLQTSVETAPGDRLANFAYAAPEQCGHGEVDRRADVYALGVILNEMFTGELLRGTGHKRIDSVAPDFAYLDAVVHSMVRQSPAERPATLAQICEAVFRASQ